MSDAWRMVRFFLTSYNESFVNIIKMHNRNIVLDIAKFIGILLMILGHCGEIPYMPFRHFIFTFHMPLFFIISGYFYKRKNIKSSLIKDAKHLMIPYFVTSMAVIILTFLRCSFSGDYKQVLYYITATFIGSGSNHSCLLFSHLPNIGAIWFFPALYVCKNVYNYVAKYDINKRLLYSFIIFVCATLIGRYLLFLPFSILSGLSAIIFYAIGDYLKKPINIRPLHWIIGVFCWFIAFKYSHLYLVQPQIDLYFIDVIGATTASLLVYKLSKKLNHINVLSNCFSWLGKNSMYILCFHLIDIDVNLSSFVAHGYGGIITICLRVIFPMCATWCLIKMKQGYMKIMYP